MKLPLPSITLLLAWLLTGLSGCSKPQEKANEDLDFVTHEYSNLALQGNLSGAAELIQSMPESLDKKKLYDHFQARFIDRTDGLDLDTGDPFVTKLGLRMQTYWRDALLNPSNLEDLENTLRQDGAKILMEAGYVLDDKFRQNPGGFLQNALEDRGYYSIMGRTYPLLEFMVWTKQSTVRETIILTDGPIEVDIHFLDGFISKGWINFATFGKSASGGWANQDGLFIVSPEWDLDGEGYQVSFKTHEARHFQDNRLFPNLSGADLEYRAKLTELIFADETLYSLLQKFTRNAANLPGSSHPLANWHVINDLSQTFFGGQWQEDPEAWKQIAKEEIKEKARALLEAHTRALQGLGAETTTGTIT